MTNKTVDAVVVTFNRLGELKKCLPALLEQTYEIKNLFVIDNNSTDNTWDYLNKMADKYSQIKPVHLDKNLGGAGGFNAGMKEFIKSGDSDFVWIMDDDTIPDKDALEKLMERSNIKDLGFLASNVRWIDGTVATMNIPKQYWIWNEYSQLGLTRVVSASFVSILFPRKVVKQVGYPITDFFIWGDDVEYTVRITVANDLKGYMVNNSTVVHDIKQNNNINISQEENINRIKRYYYAMRNRIFLTRKYYGKKELFRVLYRQIFANIPSILKHSKDNKWLRIKTSIKGTFAGFKFNPKIEK